MIEPGFQLYHLVFFPLAWMGIMWFVSIIGLWSTLAKAYPGRTRPSDGETFHYRSGNFGLAKYGRCLHYQTSSSGLYIFPALLFRPGHPPILIPWKEIRLLRRSRRLLWHYSQISIGTPPFCRICIPASVYEEGIDYMPGHRHPDRPS